MPVSPRTGGDERHDRQVQYRPPRRLEFRARPRQRQAYPSSYPLLLLQRPHPPPLPPLPPFPFHPPPYLPLPPPLLPLVSLFFFLPSPSSLSLPFPPPHTLSLYS